MSLNKISGKRFREELKRGHDILSNDELGGKAITYKQEMYEKGQQAPKAWSTVFVTPADTEEVNLPVDVPSQPPKSNASKLPSEAPKSQQKIASEAAKSIPA